MQTESDLERRLQDSKSQYVKMPNFQHLLLATLEWIGTHMPCEAHGPKTKTGIIPYNHHCEFAQSAWAPWYNELLRLHEHGALVMEMALAPPCKKSEGALCTTLKVDLKSQTQTVKLKTDGVKIIAQRAYAQIALLLRKDHGAEVSCALDSTFAVRTTILPISSLALNTAAQNTKIVTCVQNGCRVWKAWPDVAVVDQLYKLVLKQNHALREDLEKDCVAVFVVDNVPDRDRAFLQLVVDVVRDRAKTLRASGSRGTTFCLPATLALEMEQAAAERRALLDQATIILMQTRGSARDIAMPNPSDMHLWSLSLLRKFVFDHSGSSLPASPSLAPSPSMPVVDTHSNTDPDRALNSKPASYPEGKSNAFVSKGDPVQKQEDVGHGDHYVDDKDEEDDEDEEDAEQDTGEAEKTQAPVVAATSSETQSTKKIMPQSAPPLPSSQSSQPSQQSTPIATTSVAELHEQMKQATAKYMHTHAHAPAQIVKKQELEPGAPDVSHTPLQSPPQLMLTATKQVSTSKVSSGTTNSMSSTVSPSKCESDPPAPLSWNDVISESHM